MAKSHLTCTYIKSSKEFACVKNITRLHKCLHVMMIWDMKKLIKLTHNHNYLMETITFEVHLITLSSPKNTLVIIYKAFWFFLLLIFFFFSIFSFFFFEHIMHGHIREREKKYPIMLSFWYCTFAIPEHIDVISWLAGNSGEIVIYAFLLRFSIPSCQKEWYEC